MLGNIKSAFIVEILFSPINDKIKLELVKYNKSLQEKINISFMNYKLYSGKYIIYKEENKGEEYDAITDLLLFEGEYLNGKRNGKGKEYYDNGNFVLHFEFLNGKKWNGAFYIEKEGEVFYEIKNGKGYMFEANYNGELYFEGEYLNGERNGKGKEYNNNGKIKFEGEYLYSHKLS